MRVAERQGDARKSPRRGVFTDMPADEWYAGAVEGLKAVGVTKGCSADPPAYCPHDLVRRDQMASFITRALTD